MCVHVCVCVCVCVGKTSADIRALRDKIRQEELGVVEAQNELAKLQVRVCVCVCVCVCVTSCVALLSTRMHTPACLLCQRA